MATYGDCPPDEPFGVASDWHNIGPHRYRYWGTLLWVETHGLFTGEHAGPFFDLLQHMLDVRHDVGLIVDARGGLAVTPECRRTVASRAQSGGQSIPMAVVGGGVLVRTVFSLLTNAIRIIRKREVPAAFFKDGAEQEALDWLEIQTAERKRRALAV